MIGDGLALLRAEKIPPHGGIFYYHWLQELI